MEEQPDGDESLVKRWQAGAITTQEVGELAQRILDWMCKQDPRLVFGDEGEDLAASVVCHVVRKLPTFRGDSRFFTWVLGIAQNVLRSYYRAQKQKPPAYLEEVPGEAEHLKAPDVEMRELLGSDAINEARMLTLTEHEREVFRLRWDEQLTIKDIAAQLDMTPNATSSTWMRAARKVYAYLKKQDLL